MVARALEITDFAIGRPYTVGSGGVSKGQAVVLSSGDVVAASDDTDLAIGIAAETKAAGEIVLVYYRGTNAVVKGLVGTGDATAGDFAIAVADGLTDATVGTGTGVCMGQFLESGVAGDLVGLLMCSTHTVATAV